MRNNFFKLSLFVLCVDFACISKFVKNEQVKDFLADE